MAEFPALPLWTDAYLGDTTHLTTIEHGAYLLLLMTAWRTRDCALPDDDRLLARYARLNAQQWKRIRPILEPFFLIESGVWRQGRLTDERGAVERHRLQQSEKGKAGAQAKALKRQERDKAAAKSGLTSASAQVQPDASSHLQGRDTDVSLLPLSKDNGAIVDPEKLFWDQAKAYLQPHTKDPGKLIGMLIRDHGREEVKRAITAAQVETAVDPKAYVVACLRRSAVNDGPAIC